MARLRPIWQDECLHCSCRDLLWKCISLFPITFTSHCSLIDCFARLVVTRRALQDKCPCNTHMEHVTSLSIIKSWRITCNHPKASERKIRICRCNSNHLIPRWYTIRFNGSWKSSRMKICYHLWVFLSYGQKHQVTNWEWMMQISSMINFVQHRNKRDKCGLLQFAAQTYFEWAKLKYAEHHVIVIRLCYLQLSSKVSTTNIHHAWAPFGMSS
jgi:hypothetical protein